MDLHLRLVVGGRRERLALRRWDRRVALNELRHHATQRFNAERERRHVEQQHILDVAREDAALDCGADRHHLVRVHTLRRLLATEERLDRLNNGGHARHAANQNDLIDLGWLQSRILEGGEHWGLRLLNQVGNQGLELRSGQGHHHVLRTGRIGRDVRQVDLGLARAGELDLGLLRRLLEALEGLLILRQVDPLVLLELGQEPVDDALVEVVAAKVRVAVRRLHLKDAVAKLEDRDVERATTKVVHGDLLFLLLVETVGERRRGWLIDDALHIEARNAAGIFRCLSLRVVKVGRHRDHGLGDLLAEERLCIGLQLLQNHRRDLLWRIGSAIDLDLHAVAAGILLYNVGNKALRLQRLSVVETSTHETLDAKDGVRWIRHRLALRQLANESLAALAKTNNGWNGSSALGGANHRWLTANHGGNNAVRGSKIDPDNLSHLVLLFLTTASKNFQALWSDRSSNRSPHSPPQVAEFGHEFATPFDARQSLRRPACRFREPGRSPRVPADQTPCRSIQMGSPLRSPKAPGAFD